MAFVVPASARSWVDVPAHSDFPIQNLPFGFAQVGIMEYSAVSRIGDYVINLAELCSLGILDGEEFPTIEALLDFSPDEARSVRKVLFEILREDTEADRRTIEKRALIPIGDVEMELPMDPPNYLDFYSGIHHATRVGRLFRPDAPPLSPNYRQIPVAYHGRSGTVGLYDEIVRPNGVFVNSDGDVVFGATRELDFEVELGCWFGEATGGQPIDTFEAADYLLGVTLLNDWSARDIQRFESSPLGPLLGKSFATSVSPWVVTFDALEPFRVSGITQEPDPLPHLHRMGSQHYAIQLEAWIQTPRMRQPQRVCRTSAESMYWSFAQQAAHVSSNGTPIESGDLHGSGTLSGEDSSSLGCLLEITERGTKPLFLHETGETRRYLEDGDVVIFRGFADNGQVRIGFGDVRWAVVGG
jgi:fumarylacetoacetase